ncbi:MAG TPA: DUF3047 domain-containing protein [Nitrospiria bacterium]
MFKKMITIYILALGLVFFSLGWGEAPVETIDLGLSPQHYQEGKTPEGWKFKGWFGKPKGAGAEWVKENGVAAVRLESKGVLTFLQKRVNIDIKQFPIVTWKWKVENILEGIDERTQEGDDHPIRIFFVFEPDESKQSLWFRIKRFLYLDWVHGHPVGGRFTEFLWSSHLTPGDIINDPGKPWQKLMVIEGRHENVDRWFSYKRNLYEDFKKLYKEEPRRLIFIGILNDTDQTGQDAVSYITDLKFHKG